MADVGLRGSNADQDTRFKDKEALAVKATKFPAHFSEKVDLRKVNISVLRPWIAQKVLEMIRVDDDVVVEYVFGMLEDKDNPIPDPKKMQVSLLGFMDKYGAAAFMDALWTLLLSAQKTVGGVPAEFIAAKKAELEKRQAMGRPIAEESFDSRGAAPSGNVTSSLPPRPSDGGRGGAMYRPSPPRERDRDDGYRRGPPGRFDDRDRPRDSGYGQRARPRSPESPPRGGGGGYRRASPPPPRRRSPSPPLRRRSPSPPPRRRRSPSPPPARRRRSPSPRRPRERSITPPLRRRAPAPQRDRSITPPLRQRAAPAERDRQRKRSDTPPMRRSPSPPPRKAQRGRQPSRSPESYDSRARSATITPPRRTRDQTPPVRRARSPVSQSLPPRRRPNSPTPSPPPRRRRHEDSPPTRKKRDEDSPPPRRRDSPSPPPRRRASPSPPLARRARAELSPSPPPKRKRDGEDDGVVKKGRGRFTVEDEKERKLEGPLGRSKWAKED